MKVMSRIAVAVLMTLLAGSALAGSFIVPTDDELVHKSAAIAIGTVEGSFVQEDHGTIETVYDYNVRDWADLAKPGVEIGDRLIMCIEQPALCQQRMYKRVVD